jgi:hypothetical protein
MKRDRIYVTTNDKIEKEENNLVTLTLESGEVIKTLEPRRLFPVSREDKYVTLLDSDGDEVAIIKDMSELSEDSYKAVKYSLDDYYLVPKILKILVTGEKYGTLRWTVETDRGIKSFDIRNRNHDIKVYKDGKVRVRDSDDNRYTIDDYNKLDPHSKARLIADM